MANAVPDENDGCKIYLFTDATAKDGGRMSEVTSLFDSKGVLITLKLYVQLSRRGVHQYPFCIGCSLIPVLTGCCGACPSPCDTTGQEYCENHATDISSETDGTTSGKSVVTEIV